MTTFPTLTPSSRTFTPGRHPHSEIPTLNGLQTRVRSSNVIIEQRLRLGFIGLTEAQMLSIRSHYIGQQGRFLSFAIPTSLLSGMATPASFTPSRYSWLYAGAPQVEDIPCAQRYNVTVELVTEPPEGVSVNGATGSELTMTARISAGAAQGLSLTAGFSLTVSASFVGGAAQGLSLATGFSLTVSASFTPFDYSNSANIGQATEGGFFAGLISHTADGVATHALIVAPRATGATGTDYTLTTDLQWKTSSTTTAGTTGSFDGAVNTAAMVTAGIADHPAANFCKGLSIGGFTDWYLPAKLELDIAYENLKPTTASNNTLWGINAYSVPKRTANRTTSVPAQTSVAAFQEGGAEAFLGQIHWSSSEASAGNGSNFSFSSGLEQNENKIDPRRVRAFRKVAL